MMKRGNITAILAALMLLTACTGCGAKSDMMYEAAPADITAGAPAMNGIEGAAAPEAFDDAADEAFGDAEEAAGRADYDDYDGYAEDAGYEAEEAYDFSTAGIAADAAAAVPKAVPEADGDMEIMPEDPIPTEVPVPSAEVGILTAGEWRDHDNWGFFANLVNAGTISFPSFGIDPTQRIAVHVKNAEGTALPNAKVQLTSADGAVIWNAVSDKNGVAYVFETNGQKGTGISVTTPDGLTGSAVPEGVQTDEQGGSKKVSDRMTEVIVDASPVLYQNTQIMFIVDTTGSMGDEMLYLQSDFSAIAEETGDGRTSYAVSFYKDEGDSYVTRIGRFTTNVQAIRSQLNAESADGGGDEPEAVAEALSEAFHLDGWADDSVKIAFLIYDAPPHTGKETMLQDAIAAASEKGIHLVPVVSSNGSRETELFGRAVSICTNGSYVFLTDHSGVGGSHLEPIIGDYEVEKLHDIIVRIINDYKQ